MRLRIAGSSLIGCDSEVVRLYDVSDGTARLVAERRDPSVLNAFLPDPAGEKVSRIENGRFARSVTAPGQSGHWASQRSTVAVYDLTLNEQSRFESQRLGDRSLALSPDGEVIASVARGAGVVGFDARSGARRFEEPGAIASGVSWSPDGRWIAAGDTDQSGGQLYLLDMTADAGERRRALPAPSSRAPLFDAHYESLFTSDSQLVAFCSAAWGQHGVVVYDVATGTERWSETFMAEGDDEEEVEEWNSLELDLAADGRVLVAGIEHALFAWRVADGEVLTTLFCEGASALYFAVDEERRCVWFIREGAIASEPWPENWR